MKIPNFQIKNVEASSTLLFVAIIIEILVAALGVFLGVVMVSEGSSQVELSIFNRMVPAMIFFVVAAVELTRVPLIISIYRSYSLLWKLFGSIFLLLIMFVAFETMMAGFKRNVTMMEGDLNIYRLDQDNIQNQLDEIDKQIEENSLLTLDNINQTYNDTIATLNQERENRLSVHYRTLDNIETEITGSNNVALSNEIESLKDQIIQTNSQKNIDLDRIEKNYNNKINDLNNRIDVLIEKRSDVNSQIASLPKGFFGNVNPDKLKTLNSEIENINKSIQKLEREKNTSDSNFSSDIEDINRKYDELITGYQSKLEYSNQRAIDNQSVKENSYKGQKNTANKAIEDIDSEISQRELDAKIFKDKQLIKFEEKSIAIDNLTDQRIELQRELIDVNNSINKETQGNLIYLFAENFSGFVPSCKGVTQPSDVSVECKGFVETIWFGSLSAIVALTGTAVALGSEVLRTGNARKRNNPYGRRSFRYILVGIYKYVRRPKIKKEIVEKIIEKPVEVIKEVAVQKVEFTEVPKIQEVIKKEIVHVPLYTNDESLIDIKKNKKAKNNTDESS